MTDPTGCARTVVANLLAGGVREAVLSPGSRSAPLAYALHEADAAGRLRLHVRIDERSAAFLALGLAKAGGAPVPVLTTSGTATASLHPAVLEAAAAHVPLLALTADRPRGMRHTGANQTVDQERLYGAALRAYAAVSDVVPDPAGWRFESQRLLAAATGTRSRRPGPVQLNLEFTDPRPPRADDPGWAEADIPLVGGVPLAEPVRLLAGPPTVVVAGDGDPHTGAAIAELAARAGVPLLAEPSSNARRGSAAIALYRLALRSTLSARIERVVVVGRPTLSRPILALLTRSDVEVIVVSPYADWPDPGRTASRVVDAIDLEPDRSGWLASWQRVDAQLRRELDRLRASDELDGMSLAAAVASSVSGGDVLVVGASQPLRDLDLAPIAATPPRVFANRGVSGIDGTVSTAIGIALATGRPTTALLGDLTLLHDGNALVLGPDEPRPDLRIVVANDDGGSIFATLEPGAPDHAGAFERLFGTPHGTDLAALAAAHHIAHRSVNTTPELRAALATPVDGIELVEVVVDRSRRRAAAEAMAALRVD